jgi:hypothetical protein
MGKWIHSHCLFNGKPIPEMEQIVPFDVDDWRKLDTGDCIPCFSDMELHRRQTYCSVTEIRTLVF